MSEDTKNNVDDKKNALLVASFDEFKNKYNNIIDISEAIICSRLYWI